MGRSAIASTTAAVAIATGGCGGNGGGDETRASPRKVVSRAATEMANVGTSRVAVNAAIEIEPAEEKRVEAEMDGEGLFDFSAERGEMTYDMSELAGEGVQMEVVFDRSTYYSKLPSRFLEPGTWVKVEAENESAPGAGLFAEVSQAPSAVLTYLKLARGLEKVGEQDVRGVPTVHYRGTVESADGGVPVEFWIDDDGLVRRMAVEFDFKLMGTGNPAHMSQSIDYFDFGIEVDVRLPPKDKVKDVKELLEEARS